MTEMDNRIAKMPAKMAFAVLDLRKVHACIMELPRSKSVYSWPERRHTSTTLKVRVENSVRFHFIMNALMKRAKA